MAPIVFGIIILWNVKYKISISLQRLSYRDRERGGTRQVESTESEIFRVQANQCIMDLPTKRSKSQAEDTQLVFLVFQQTVGNRKLFPYDSSLTFVL